MAKIKITNRNRRRPIDLSGIKKLAAFVANDGEFGGRFARTGINIVFLTDAGIRSMNKRFKGRDRETDVLCFCFFDTAKDNLPGSDAADIYISSDTAGSNALRFGTSFMTEIRLYVIHGLLHMAGYRDHTAAVKNKMFTRQSGLLRSFEAMSK